MPGLFLDVRVALRRLRRSPVFTVFALASLALGIGVSTAVYSCVYTLFWSPLGIERAESVVPLLSGSPAQYGIPWSDFRDLRQQQSSFSMMCASFAQALPVVAGNTARTVLAEAVSGDYFATLGIRPAVGRLLGPTDEQLGERVAVVSESFWRTTLGATPDVIGRRLRLAGELFEVVGVARSPFRGMVPLQPVALWVPLSPGLPDAVLPRAREGRASRRFPMVEVWGRLRSDTGLAQASSEVAVIGRRLDEQFPREARTARNWSVRRYTPWGTGAAGAKNVPNMFLALGFVVILIATVNVANLSLARGTARVRERTIRGALGASRARLVREQLIESGLLVVGGGALSWGVLVGLLRSLSAELPLTAEMSLDFEPVVSPQVLVAAFACMTVAFLVSGLWPAVQSTRRDTRDNLEAGGFATPPKWRLHRTIVAWQICGSAALFMLAAVCIKGVTSLARDGSALAFDRIAIAQIDFQANGAGGAVAADVVTRILTALRALPGIESASASTGLPLRGMAPATVIAPLDKSRSPEHASVIAATPDVHATFGIRLIRGRGFDDTDDAAGRRVAVVSAGLARSLFGAGEVLGQSIMFAGTGHSGSAETFTVVGVSADTSGDRTRAMPLVFVPLGRVPEGRVTIVARARSAELALGILRSTTRQVDPDLALGLSGTGRAIAERQSLVLRRSAQLAALLGTLALLLAMAGLYGVLSHAVFLRTREFGIRLALGAPPGRIFTMILWDGLQPVAKGLLLGIMIGLMAPVAARAFVSSDLAPYEPLALAFVPLPFVICAVAACYLPAARASKVDPSVSLRHL